MQNSSEIEYYHEILNKCKDCVDSETYGEFLCVYEHLSKLIKEKEEGEDANQEDCDISISFKKKKNDTDHTKLRMSELINCFNELGFDIDLSIRPTESEDGKGCIFLCYTE
jgi:hypothetical protein